MINYCILVAYVLIISNYDILTYNIRIYQIYYVLNFQ